LNASYCEILGLWWMESKSWKGGLQGWLETVQIARSDFVWIWVCDLKRLPKGWSLAFALVGAAVCALR
jgi:hypothetical protein